MKYILLITALFSFAIFANAQGSVQLRNAGVVGKDVELTLPTTYDDNCVSVHTELATIIFSRKELESLGVSGSETWRNEKERLAIILSERTKKLLSVVKGKDEYGCGIALERELGDAVYAVTDLLKSGKAVVIPVGKKSPRKHIFIRYSDCEQGPCGDVEFKLDRVSPAFLKALWWTA